MQRFTLIILTLFVLCACQTPGNNTQQPASGGHTGVYGSIGASSKL